MYIPVRNNGEYTITGVLLTPPPHKFYQKIKQEELQVIVIAVDLLNLLVTQLVKLLVFDSLLVQNRRVVWSKNRGDLTSMRGCYTTFVKEGFFSMGCTTNLREATRSHTRRTRALK